MCVPCLEAFVLGPGVYPHLHDQAVGDATHACTAVAVQAGAKHAQLRQLWDEVARELALTVCLHDKQITLKTHAPGFTDVVCSS